MIQQKIQKLAQTPPGAFEVIEQDSLLLNLGVGLVLALAMRWHFQTFGSTFSNRREFSRNFPLIMLTTILVISIIKSSIALSLGLVGALSIVRFRTPIKEPEELAYLFLAIGLGLGLGAELTQLTVVAGVTILVAMALVQWSSRDGRGKGVFLSIEWLLPAGQENPLDQLARIIGQHASGNDVRRVDSQADKLDATFFVDLLSMDELSDMLAHLHKDCLGVSVTVVDQNRMPSV